MNRDFAEMLDALFAAEAEFSSSARMRLPRTVGHVPPVISTSGFVRLLQMLNECGRRLSRLVRL
ncbi:MAG TPA: hypothetical protein VGA33_10075 [Thermoanaerobaculia bacterium]